MALPSSKSGLPVLRSALRALSAQGKQTKVFNSDTIQHLWAAAAVATALILHNLCVTAANQAKMESSTSTYLKFKMWTQLSSSQAPQPPQVSTRMTIHTSIQENRFRSPLTTKRVERDSRLLWTLKNSRKPADPTSIQTTPLLQQRASSRRFCST